MFGHTCERKENFYFSINNQIKLYPSQSGMIWNWVLNDASSIPCSTSQPHLTKPTSIIGFTFTVAIGWLYQKNGKY